MIDLSMEVRKLKLKKYQKYILAFTIIVYIYILLSIIIFKYGSPMDVLSGKMSLFTEYNLIPFKDLYNSKLSHGINMTAIIGNIILFVPLGILLQMKNGKTIKNVFYGLGLSLAFEISQFVFKIGSFDVNDLILNTFGALIGVVIYKVIKALFGKKFGNKIIIVSGFIVSILVIGMEVLLNMAN